MAQPTTPIEVWARDTLDLPVTGEVNKQRPIDDLWSKGYDRGQKPACEEFNYVINMLTAWMKYIQSEGLPSYLPINGTKITFSGDLTGNASFTGNSQVTANVQVVDNSHNHISSNITDASSVPTPNVLVKRDANGGTDFGRYTSIVTDGSNADLWFRRTGDNGTTTGLNYSQSANIFQIYFIGNSGTAISSTFRMSPNLIELTNPRSLTGQEGQPNSLVRFDYLNSTATNLNNSFNNSINNTNNNVNNVNNDLQNYKNSAANTFIQGIRQSSEIAMDSSSYVPYSNGRRAIVPGGAYLTSMADYSTGRQWIEDVDGIWYKYLQYSVNGNWYNIGSL